MEDVRLLRAILDGYADPDWNNLDHIRLSIALFGGVYIGVQISQRELDQWRAGEPWTSTERGSEGHALWVPKYDGEWLYCVTWGTLQPMSPDFFTAHCDEAHTLRSPLFLDAQGEAASQIDLEAWDTDLAILQNTRPYKTSQFIYNTKTFTTQRHIYNTTTCRVLTTVVC